jgi:hypothetical protein
MMHKHKMGIIIIAFLALLNSGCKTGERIKTYFSQEPEVEAITEVIKTTLPLAYAASLAMAAADGNVAPNVQVINPVYSYPGNGLMYINIGQGSGLPVLADTTATIIVAGLWSSQEMAFLSVSFVNLDFGQMSFTLSNVHTFPVIRDSGGIIIVYANQDINAGTSDTVITVSLTQSEINAELNRLYSRPALDSLVTVEQDGWVIRVDNNLSYTDPSDDEYTITGAGQYLGAGQTDIYMIQAVMIAAAMRPSCRLNPFEGGALLRNLEVSSGDKKDWPEFGTSFFMFHSECDGEVDLTLATGCYIGSSGSTVDLNLDQ